MIQPSDLQSKKRWKKKLIKLNMKWGYSHKCSWLKCFFFSSYLLCLWICFSVEVFPDVCSEWLDEYDVSWKLFVHFSRYNSRLERSSPNIFLDWIDFCTLINSKNNCHSLFILVFLYYVKALLPQDFTSRYFQMFSNRWECRIN